MNRTSNIVNLISLMHTYTYTEYDVVTCRSTISLIFYFGSFGEIENDFDFIWVFPPRVFANKIQWRSRHAISTPVTTLLSTLLWARIARTPHIDNNVNLKWVVTLYFKHIHDGTTRARGVDQNVILLTNSHWAEHQGRSHKTNTSITATTEDQTIRTTEQQQ